LPSRLSHETEMPNHVHRRRPPEKTGRAGHGWTPLGKENEKMRKLRSRLVALLPLVFVAIQIGLSAEWSIASSSEKCGSNQSRRFIKGPEKLLSQLHKKAEKSPNSPFFPKGKFDEEEFKYVGKIKLSERDRYELVLLTTTWGESCRSTRLLLVFNADGAYLGNYSSLPDEPKKLSGAKLQFSFDPADGNTIEFTDSMPPSVVRLDGEIIKFESVRKPNHKDTPDPKAVR
jgi:hypothetical protein